MLAKKCSSFILIIMLLAAIVARGQYSEETPELKKRSVQMSGDYCDHSDGGMKGASVASEYTHYFTKRLSLGFNLRATIHNDKYPVPYDVGGSTVDGSIRVTTAGIQLGATGGFSLINIPRHEFRISLGPFVRYESDSNGEDGYAVYFPSQTGVNAYLVAYDNHTPQETVSFGVIIQAQYNYTFRNNLFLGVQSGYQTDTQDDQIFHMIGIAVGKRF